MTRNPWVAAITGALMIAVGGAGPALAQMVFNGWRFEDVWLDR